MSKKFTVQHVGFPVAGRSIRDDEWKVYSTHTSANAALTAVDKAQEGLGSGEWNDHYRIVDPDGHIMNIYNMRIERSEKEMSRISRK